MSVAPLPESFSSLIRGLALRAEDSEFLLATNAYLASVFGLSASDLATVVLRFLADLQRGLPAPGTLRPEDGVTPDHPGFLKMLPSHVTRLPDGSERGHCLALDLGGTNFRVVGTHLLGEGRAETVSERYTIPGYAKDGNAQDLFGFIAASIAGFLKLHPEYLPEPGQGPAPLAFTFSFPTQQDGLSSARLTNWTKGFSTQGVIGEDVGALLNTALEALDVPYRVTAIINDTVGTLISFAYSVGPDQGNLVSGVILGTGANAAYMERVELVGKLHDKVDLPTTAVTRADSMVLNIEWGTFGSMPLAPEEANRRAGLAERLLSFRQPATEPDADVPDEPPSTPMALPFTPYDDLLDMGSVHPGRQRFEKCIAGLYLGELALLTLRHLAARGVPGTSHPRVLFGQLTRDLPTSDDVQAFLDAAGRWSGETLARCEELFLRLAMALRGDDKVSRKTLEPAARDLLTELAALLGVRLPSSPENPLDDYLVELLVLGMTASYVSARAARLAAAGIAAIGLQTGLLGSEPLARVVSLARSETSRLLAPLTVAELGALKVAGQPLDPEMLLGTSPTETEIAAGPGGQGQPPEEVAFGLCDAGPPGDAAVEVPAAERLLFGIDGSVFEFYPHFPGRMHRALTDLFGPRVGGRFSLQHAKDGSSVGAALAAN
ncbi:hypothetical protein H696_03060 [Fonticula alba]|uniref:hexokinase n=1 Tax=Fonticula alba TaxID=691883 RepID=A0A058ZBA3_FONAL|nr:hypothetical protein H696_03060 [Fonticula alba]KCV70707.1 hypothetical protein H696_03060 [Fonticula alba]|eukprot:XP_009495223.1 hypothetical protein H696_03060 [Fonticula alba]